MWRSLYRPLSLPWLSGARGQAKRERFAAQGLSDRDSTLGYRHRRDRLDNLEGWEMIELIQIKSGEIDDSPNEKEWHAMGPFEGTACGLAFEFGSTDRTFKSKQGGLKQISCQVCKTTINFYKNLK